MEAGQGGREEEGMSGSIHRLSRENGEDVWREAGSVAPLFLSLSLSHFSGWKNCHLLKKANYGEKEKEGEQGGRRLHEAELRDDNGLGKKRKRKSSADALLVRIR